MHGYYAICCLVVFCCFTQSSQSPQSSFFGWASNEAAEVPTTETQTPSATSSSPAMEQTNSFSAQEQLTRPEMSNITGSANSTVNLSNTTKLPLIDNSTSGLSNYLGDEISYFLTTSVVFLGAALGRDGCDLKAACLAGTLVPSIQGRDIAMVAAEPLIPEGWKIFYQAAKASMIQGQNCTQFNCL